MNSRWVDLLRVDTISESGLKGEARVLSSPMKIPNSISCGNDGSEMSFIEDFQRTVSVLGCRRDWSPAGYLEAWSSFVDMAQKGYSGDIYEYDNEISVREELEKILENRSLSKWSEYAVFVAEVQQIDDKIRSVIFNGPIVRPGDRWWLERIVPFAERGLVGDVYRLYSIILKEME